ncbi:unnamed protein product [Peronospora effusa]|uniref:UPF3 domain-containing protein n=1 Tax=Peronospora effusa TaxID=542832 RepID=A0A3M6VSA1_9STRA|nr:hypothetical protein DD238_002620 [Peronospora effusa]CAI5721849.1 unnamed protein product [Peronospora effusa]
MSPPPRRGKGRGRGGRGGDRRLSIDNTIATSKNRERGSSSHQRGGGRGGGGGSSTVSSSSAVNSVRPTRTVMTVLKKLVVRNIPPTTSEEEVREMLKGYGIGHEVIWRFVPGRNRRKNNREPIPARLYLDLKKQPEKIKTLIAALHGQLFCFNVKETTDIKPLEVEFAPFQKIPREKQRKDAKVGTIDRDPEYVAFLNELAKPKDKLPSAEPVVDMAEGETVEKPVAALVKYLNERKVHSRDKGKGKSGGKSIVKNAHRQKGKKTSCKQKSTKEKSKLPKDRKKKSSSEAAELKSGKQYGRASSKKESTKQELAEPGMLRIMISKSVAAVGDSALPPAGTAPSTDASSERGSEKRSSKGGKKNGSRGRTNPRKSKDGIDGAEGEGTNLKPHARRKGGNGGKKEPRSKGERKKVFAPKDATLQGTPSKS